MAEVLTLPVVTAEQMREVDRLMIEKYDIGMMQMMENAGRNLAEVCKRCLGNQVSGRHIVVAVGKGNNGGGGLVAARHLSNWGADITILAVSRELRDTPARQLRSLQKLPVQVMWEQDALRYLKNHQPDLIIDALIGYNLTGAPRGASRRMIEAINASDVNRVVSLDVPSGLNATSGEAYTPCVRAEVTLTLALPKTGLLSAEAAPCTGKLFLGDISVPPALYREIGLEVDTIFEKGMIVDLQNLTHLSSKAIVAQTGSESPEAALAAGHNGQCLLLGGD